MKAIIEVEITNIEVDEEYYSFNYQFTFNGVKSEIEEYSGDYENGSSPKEWKKELEDGYALQVALEHFDINNF